MANDQALFYYARSPKKDFVGKTRLGTSIKNQEAANALAQALILDMLDQYTPNQDEYDLYTIEDFPNINLEDVGVGMNTIFTELLKKHSRVIIIGSDIPEVSFGKILDNFTLLQTYSLTFVPVADKGYGLIGMSEYVDVFSEI